MFRCKKCNRVFGPQVSMGDSSLGICPLCVENSENIKFIKYDTSLKIQVQDNCKSSNSIAYCTPVVFESVIQMPTESVHKVNEVIKKVYKNVK